MIVFENECVGPCPQGCLGSTCPNRHVPHYYCDWCDEEYRPSELYEVDGEQVCKDCILGQYSTVEK